MMPIRDEIVGRAVRQHQLGQMTDALVGYKRALTLYPSDASVMHLVGVAHCQADKPDLALQWIGRALLITDQVAEFHNNIALAWIECEMFVKARDAVLSAAVLTPGYADALVNLSAACRELGLGAEADRSARRAIQCRPDSAAGFNTLGLNLRQCGRHEDAVMMFRRAVSCDPAYAKAQHNLGLVLMDLGRDEAKPAFVRSLRLTPLQVQYFRNFSVLHRFVGQDVWLGPLRVLQDRMAEMNSRQQIDMHFILAKVHEDLGDPALSFRQLVAGNALKRKIVDYDESATLAMFTEIERYFTRQLLVDKGGRGDPSEMPVFIVGMPRSGTSLVEQIMASHSKIFGAGELDVFGKSLDALADQVGAGFPALVAGLTSTQLYELGHLYADALHAKSRGARFVIDKMPGNLPFVGMIRLALPNARIIMVERDPIDTCLSCFSKHFIGSLSYTYDLAELGRYARAYARLQQHWRRVLSDDRLLTVRYEDIVLDLEGQSRRLIAFCGLPWEAECLNFYKTERAVRTASVAQVRQPIYRSSIGRWRPEERLLAPLLNALRGEGPSESVPVPTAAATEHGQG